MLGHAELINNSLAIFIRDLFAVVHPAHAARLCVSYIRALRSKEDAPFEVRRSQSGGKGMKGVFVSILQSDLYTKYYIIQKLFRKVRGGRAIVGAQALALLTVSENAYT